MCKKIVNILILFILIGFTSCKPKQVYIDRVVTDTVRVSNSIIVTLPAVQQLKIEKPCDSLGNLKPFTLYANTGKTSVKIVGKNNIITAFINIDSIKQSAVDTYKSNQTKEKQTIIKTVTPKWVYQLIIYSIIVTVLLLWKFGILKLII